MAKTIIFYMAREWITWFLGCLFFLVGTIFLFSTVEDLDHVFPRGIDHCLADFGNWLLSYLPWLMPICCLGASLFSLSFVRKRGEWTAMLANGISPWQSFLLIVLIGMGIGWTNHWLINKEGNRTIEKNDGSKSILKMQIGSDRLWYFRSFDSSTLTGKDLQLFCYGKQGEDVMRIRAKQAAWDPENGWTFFHGRFLGFYSSLGLPIINQEGTSLKWEKDSIDLGHKNFYQTKSPGINRSFEKLSGLKFMDDPIPYIWLQKRAKDMSFFEIDRLLDQFPNLKSEEINPYRLRKSLLWWNGPACVVALLIGLGLGSTRSASTPAKLAGVSILGALGFYLIRTLSDSLGEQQILSPMLAASMPYIIIILGTFIFLKLKR